MDHIKLIDDYYQMNPQQVILYYRGSFDESVLNRLSRHLKQALPDDPRTAKKVFSVFIELAQNIAYYSVENNLLLGEEKSKGVGNIMIYRHDEDIIVKAGNMLNNRHLAQITAHCDEINQLTKEELKKLKREIRSKPIKDGHKGASIGLIHTAIKSDAPLSIESQQIDEQLSYFTLSIQINTTGILN